MLRSLSASNGMNIGIDGRLWNETGVGRHLRALVDYAGILDKTHTFYIFLRAKEYNDFKLPNERWHKIVADVPWHTIWEQIRMPGIYKKAPLDLLHVPYFAVPILTDIPFIATIHDLTISQHATGKATTRPLPIYFLKQLGYRLLLRLVIMKARHLLTVSETVRQQLIKTYSLDPNKITVTYEAGGLEGSYRTLPSPHKKPYLLYVGNANPHKNLLRLIEAFQLVRQKMSDLRLVLVGKDDFFYKRLEREVKDKKMEQGITFVGEVPNKELWNWYRHAACFIFPSLSEGFGIPGLEAMSVGCPVLASDLPVFHEVYGDAAEYFDPKDTQSISRVILNFLPDKKSQQELIKLGKIQYKKFSWEDMTKKTLAIYENCFGI